MALNSWKIFSIVLLGVIGLGLLIPVDAQQGGREIEATEVDCDNPCIDETELTFDPATQYELDLTNTAGGLMASQIADLFAGLTEETEARTAADEQLASDLAEEAKFRKAFDDYLMFDLDRHKQDTNYEWGDGLIETDNRIDVVDAPLFIQVTIDNVLGPPLVVMQENDYVVENLHAETAQVAEIANDVKDHSITLQKYGWESIASWAIIDNTVGSNDIRDASITSTDIKDETITRDDIADLTITGDDIADRSIGSNKIAQDSITSDEIAEGVIGMNIYDKYAETGLFSGEFNTITLVCNSPHDHVIKYYVQFENDDVDDDDENSRISNVQRILDGGVFITFEVGDGLAGADWAHVWYTCASFDT